MDGWVVDDKYTLLGTSSMLLLGTCKLPSLDDFCFCSDVPEEDREDTLTSPRGKIADCISTSTWWTFAASNRVSFSEANCLSNDNR